MKGLRTSPVLAQLLDASSNSNERSGKQLLAPAPAQWMRSWYRYLGGR